MAKCPHDCPRCRLIEAGFGGRALTPQEFVEVFGVVEVESERAPLAEETLEASTAVEAARTAYDVAHRDVGKIILKGNPRDPGYEDALAAAAAERTEAGARLKVAKARLHALVRRDQEAWHLERAAAEQRERAERKQAEREAERKRRQGFLGRVKATVGGGRR